MSEELVASVDDGLYQQLMGFGKLQFSNLDKDQLSESTANITAMISFLVGAIYALAKKGGHEDFDHAPVLQRYIMAKFKMPERNALGVIESNARMYQKYTYLENAYNEGYQAAMAWCDDETAQPQALGQFLKKHKDVSMSNLSAQGIKADAEVAEVESVSEPEPIEEAIVVMGSSVRPVFIFWFIAALLLMGMNYLLFKILL